MCRNRSSTSSSEAVICCRLPGHVERVWRSSLVEGALDQPLSPLRIGVVEAGPSSSPITEERSAAVAAAARLLEEGGHVIERLLPTELEPLLFLAQQFFEQVICAALASLAAATRDTARVSYALAQRFEQFDAIITPMLADAAPLVGALPTDGDHIDRHFARMSALAPYAALANAAGLPAISVPQRLDTAGLPLAIQIVGPIGSDVRLLQLARFFERSAPWSFPFHRLS